MSSPSNKFEKNKKIYRAIVVGLLLLSIILFSFLWLSNAYNIAVKNEETINVLNDERLYSVNSTVVIQNYIPFLKSSADPSITKSPYSSPNDNIDNNNQSLSAAGIEIDKIVISQMYGDKEVYPTFTINNPRSFSGVSLFGMSEATIKINWRYNITQDGSSVAEKYNFNMVNDVVQLRAPLKSALYLMAFSFFIVSGFFISRVIFRDKKFDDAFWDLTKFDGILKEKSDDVKFNDCKKSLTKVVEFPEGIHSVVKYFFGVSILIFKMAINYRCKKQLAKWDDFEIAPYKKASLKKVLDKYTKQTLEKIEDNMPELKTIVVAITFLGGIGITFSLNTAAISALLFSIGLFYLFTNIGSAFYFVNKSREEVLWIVGLLAVSCLIIFFPILLEISRGAL